MINKIQGETDFETAKLKLGVYIHRLAQEYKLTELQLAAIFAEEIQTSIFHLRQGNKRPANERPSKAKKGVK